MGGQHIKMTMVAPTRSVWQRNQLHNRDSSVSVRIDHDGHKANTWRSVCLELLSLINDVADVTVGGAISRRPHQTPERKSVFHPHQPPIRVLTWTTAQSIAKVTSLEKHSWPNHKRKSHLQLMSYVILCLTSDPRFMLHVILCLKSDPHFMSHAILCLKSDPHFILDAM